MGYPINVPGQKVATLEANKPVKPPNLSQPNLLSEPPCIQTAQINTILRRHITDSELEYLRTAIGVSTEESVMAPPWRAMLTSRAVWAIIIAHFAENWGFYTLLTGLPMFMRGKDFTLHHKFTRVAQ